jgi:integrase
MPRIFDHSHTCHGRSVGFSVRQFGDEKTYYACFNDPDGRRFKRRTNHTRKGAAVTAARLIIEQVYAPPAPANPQHPTWVETIERLKARLVTSGNRPGTIGYYLKLIRLLRKRQDLGGPADLTPALAADWRDWMMRTPGRRKKLPSAHYVAGLILGLSALWQKWFIDDLKIVSENPWKDVEPPKTDKLPVKYATDDLIEPFYTWIASRFGGWTFPKLFLSVKAYTGCRLMDLCGLRSGQLRGGRLTFPADLTKGRKERAVPLPADLFAALDAFKGPAWLWENYLPGLKAALKAKGFPTHKLGAEFLPRRLYFWIESLFADYRKAFPDRPVLTTHMFRKRAFTLAWQMGIDMREASIAFGCNVDTLMQHYVALNEQETTDSVFERMHGMRSS